VMIAATIALIDHLLTDPALGGSVPCAGCARRAASRAFTC
jgi:hypothetical protein